MKRNSTGRRPFIRFLFVVYGCVLLWLLFGRSFGWDDGLSYRQMLARNVNLQPFLTIRNYWYVILHSQNQPLVGHCIINLAGNVLLFIPLGWLLPDIFRAQRRLWTFLLTCFIGDLLVELTQLFSLLGSFDIDDVILNLSGLLLGYILWKLFHKRK